MGEKYDHLLQTLQSEVQPQSFERYILRSEQHKSELIFNIRTTKTKGLPRFNMWRLLLEIIPFTQSWEEKVAKLEGSRKRWTTLKNQSRAGPKVIGKQGPLSLPRNPLMKATVKTEKKQPENDSFLNEQIKKDVSRTYQELPFFQDAAIIRLLTNVLFVWCKANSDISYKQGMNEILASVVWVYFHEAAADSLEPSNEIEKKYKILNSVSHAEADIYIVFEKIMEIQKEMFKENLDSEIKGVLNPNSKINSPILQRISQIQDNKLKILDIQLYRALKLQEVKPKTFLLRWIRCLHSREFGLVGSLPIWDSILLDAYECPQNTRAKKQFEFVDAMCLSMFIYLRSIVLTLETTNEIVQVYQKYPQLEGQCLQQLLGLAWSVCGQLHSLDNKASQEEGQSKSVAVGENTFENGKKVKEKSPEPVVNKVQVDSNKVQATNKSTSSQKIGKQIEQVVLQPSKSSPVKKQSSPQQHNSHLVTFSINQLKDLIDKLTQSNSYNENGESKKIVRSVIEILEQKLKN